MLGILYEIEGILSIQASVPEVRSCDLDFAIFFWYFFPTGLCPRLARLYPFAGSMLSFCISLYPHFL